MINYFSGVILPITTLVDDWLAPKGQGNLSDGHFFLGFHCTVWIKFYVVLAVILSLSFAENVVEDAAYIKSQFYGPSAVESYNGFWNVAMKWDRESLSYKCICVGVFLLVSASLLIAAMVIETPYPIIPLQIATVGVFYRFLKTMASTYTENISNSYEIYRDMDETLARLHHYRTRNYWYTPYMSKLELPQEYAPLIKNVFLLSGICLCFVAEYFLERVMQFYGFEQTLASINRSIIVGYRRWQFKRLMAKRRSDQKARLIRRHRNVQGNFTWADVGQDWSMHTAILLEDSYDSESFHTAIALEEGKMGPAEEDDPMPRDGNKTC